MNYFDYNATAPIRPEVLHAVTNWWQYHHANPGTAYQAGRQAKQAIEDVRQQCAAYFKVSSHELIFTGSATEANNLAVLGLLQQQPPGQYILSAIEHQSVRQIGRHLAQQGWQVDFLPVSKQGVIDLDSLRKQLSRQTRLVSVQAANNETGVVQPIAEVADLCRPLEVPFHCDAVQILGRLPIPWSTAWSPDLITLTGHKAGGPIGNGILINRLGHRLQPLMLGGGQEEKLRPGTPFSAGIIGLGKLIQILEQTHYLGKEEESYRDYLELQLEKDALDHIIFGRQAYRLPNTSMVAFPGLNGAAIQKKMDEQGLAIGLGSACSSGHAAPSHVLQAMGLSNRVSLSSIRISIGWHTTQLEIERLTAALKQLKQ